MADDQSNYGPYVDEDQQYAGLLKNLINPPDAAPVKPADTPATPAPAQPAAQSTTGLAPNQHWESVTPTPAPAATSTSGASGPGGKSWQDYYQQGQAKLQQDQGTLARLQANGAGVNQIQNKFGRTAARVGDIALSTALPGLARNIPGTTAHNLQLQGQAQGRIGQDQAALTNVSQMEDRDAQAQERASRAAKETAQAQSYTPVTLNPEQAAAIGHPELAGEQLDQRAYATMLNTVQKGKDAKDRSDASNTTKKDIAGQNNETRKDIASENNQTKTDIATQNNDTRKFIHATKATRGGPNEALRQPMIDAATAQVQKLNDYTYDPDANDGAGGFYDPSNPKKTYTNEEFTDLKNQISTKLDKDLATKKLRPLGVRFNVKDTVPGKAGQPTGTGAPAAAPAQKPSTQPTPPPGATHQYRDKSGNVVGYAVNGKYVPATGAK